MIVSTLFKRYDSLLATGGVVFGVLITLLYLVSPTIYLFSIGTSLALSCFLYLIIIYLQFPVYPLQQITNNGKKLLNITFLLLFSLSLIILHSLEYRPLIYFLLYSLCAGSIAVSIYFSINKIEYFIQYLKIILLSFNIKYSIFSLAGLVPGIDPWEHAKMNYLLSQTGNIGVLFGKETYFPIMHIQTAIVELLNNTSLRDASNFAVIVPFVFASSFVYLLSKHFLGHRVGLFAMLLLNVSDFHIYWGSAPQTTSYGLMLYYLLVYTLVKTYLLNSNARWVLMSIFFGFILIITHAISSFIFLITILSLSVGSLFYNFIYKKKLVSKYEGMLLIFIPTILQYWFIVKFYKGGQSFFDILLSYLYHSITENAEFLNRPETISTFSATMPPFIERFADTCGFSLFLFFGIMGSLFCLSDRYRNRDLFSFISVLIILFGITFSFPLFGIRNIIPSRWFAFEYFFLSILASFSIFKLSTYFKNRTIRSIFVAIIFINIAFFMSTSTISDVDSPLWLKNDTYSTTYTLGEVRGAETLSEFGNNLSSDTLFGASVIGTYLGKNFTTFSLNSQPKSGTIFIWRSYMENRPVIIYTNLKGYYNEVSRAIILGQSFHSNLARHDKIYDNKELNVYFFH